MCFQKMLSIVSARFEAEKSWHSTDLSDHDLTRAMSLAGKWGRMMKPIYKREKDFNSFFISIGMNAEIAEKEMENWD